MKYLGDYTTRGQLDDSSSTSFVIPLFQGDYSIGYRVKSFFVSYADRDETATQVIHSMIATEAISDIKTWDWSDNRQVAWNRTTEDGNATIVSSPPFVAIDPENLIVEDAHIGCYIYGGSGSQIVNYMITFEKYQLEPFQGLGAIVNNMSQG